jgi:hypothetical protein
VEIVNFRGILLAMAMDCPLSADELREQFRAETVLAKIALFEDLAELHETATIRREREMLAEQYRALIGVPPGERARFRAALERIVAGDGGSVSHARDAIVGRQAKG